MGFLKMQFFRREILEGGDWRNIGGWVDMDVGGIKSCRLRYNSCQVTQKLERATTLE
jgi:hypothetical protein